MLVEKGIQLVKVKTGSGITTRFRVQIKRVDFKLDRLFESLEDAKEVVALAKSKEGRNRLLAKTQEEEKREVEFNIPPLKYWIEKYVKMYLPEIEKEGKFWEGQNLLKHRSRANQLAFIKNILSTKIPDTNALDKFLKKGKTPEDFAHLKDFINFGEKSFGDLKVTEITHLHINSYIRERLKHIKKISIQRELSVMNKIFEKLKHMSHSFIEFKSPVYGYDKTLLANALNKSSFRFEDEELEKLLEALLDMKNIENYQITMISLLTAMRRSEVVNLQWSRIFLDKSYIVLDETKTKPRKVFLTEQAKQFIQLIDKKENQDKVFKITINGFERNFQRIKTDLDLKHIKFHKIRAEAISRILTSMLNNNGQISSIVASKFIGAKSVKKLEKHIDKIKQPELANQDDLLKSVGHSHSSTTADFYFTLKDDEINIDDKKTALTTRTDKR
ncbi:tyrosine-type recombinase/integrase [Chitinolyticbacter albus]|uniref:tyrosine-type recombinase/integrase n=1 Tax=Chitinolyticbacter albus TaxID=2961951 RepID=UPI00210B22F8|nr:tyrosine-type recombinase/integrase [Chitinolyticbacter albus]